MRAAREERNFGWWWALAALLIAAAWLARASDTARSRSGTNSYAVTGVVEVLKDDGQTAVIKHEAIPDFMPAMTMPFKVKTPAELAKIHPGDVVSFRLLVTEEESWIDRVIRTGMAAASNAPVATTAPPVVAPPKPLHPLLNYKFTNELGQAASLADFRGQAVGLTFFFTRCPIPEYCPRLSKNFAEAARILKATPGGPTNWHFLSVTFDPEHDSPEVMKAYATTYNHNPEHWSFLTGSPDKIRELARQCDISYEPDGTFFNHSFRTLIIDPNGKLQMMFPTSGDLSQGIVEEMRKAMAVTNRPVATATTEASKN